MLFICVTVSLKGSAVADDGGMNLAEGRHMHVLSHFFTFEITFNHIFIQIEVTKPLVL